MLDAAGAQGGSHPGPAGVRETSQGGKGERVQGESERPRAWRKRRRALQAGGCFLQRLEVEALKACREDLQQALRSPGTPFQGASVGNWVKHARGRDRVQRAGACVTPIFCC